MVKISIAMATYNGEKYIEDQIKSIAKQTRLPDELIVSDDGSDDNTKEIIKRISKDLPFKLKLYANSKTNGICRNFNNALENTTGDLIFLSDQDDVWLPEKIEYMQGLAEEYPQALLLMNDAEITDSELRKSGKTKLGQLLAAGFTSREFIMGCCCCIRREMLNFCLPIPIEYASHDLWFSTIADGLGAKRIDPKVLQLYRRHESNASSGITSNILIFPKLSANFRLVRQVSNQKRGNTGKTFREQELLLCRALSELVHRAPVGYRNDLLKLHASRVKILALQRLRIRIRRYSILKRLCCSSILLLKGRYGRLNGIRSQLRDVLG